MSGQPYRYASDVEKFRAEYMASLGLRSNLDDLNLQANKTYKETGALPPVSQMKDTRTTSEILADNEKLKQGLMEDFKALGSASFISAVIDRIKSSSLNRDGSFFVFISQRAPEIATQLKKMYKYGIKGDANDVEKFVEFMEDMFSKTKGMTESVKSYFNRPASTAGVGAMLGVIREGDVDALKNTFDEISRKLVLKITGVKPIAGYVDENDKTYTQRLIDKTHKIAGEIQKLKNFLNTDTHKFLTEGYSSTIADPSLYSKEVVDRFHDIYKEYIVILEQFPKADYVFTLLRQLDNSLKNTDMRLSNEILTEIEAQFLGYGDLTRLDREFRETVRQMQQERMSYPIQEPAELRGSNTVFDTYGQEAYRINTMLRTGMADRQRAELERRWDIRQRYEQGDKNIDDEIKHLKTVIDEKQERLKKVISALDVASTERQVQQLTTAKDKLEKDISDTRAEISRLEDTKAVAQQELRDITGHGIKKRRGRPRGSGIVKPFKQTIAESTSSAGIYESPRYVHFGKYLVNLHRLNKDGIFAMKRPSGGNIMEIPSTRISNNLSGVIKKMIGGGVPTYKELSTLSEPEKVYLHKVASKANIEDKFSIPTPSKDAEEKDMHQFEVMKGEIMSGNDNKEFIKKFKLLLMKLSKNGSLPKSETSEILHELAELGY